MLRGETKERLDPEMLFYNKTSLNSDYEIFALKQLLSKSPQYGANESGKQRVSMEEPRYIRITDIDSNGNLKDNIGVTADVVEKKYFLNNNDILLARSGATVGKAFIFHQEKYDYKCFFAGYMIRFVVDTEKLLPDYFFYYTQTKTYAKWKDAIQRASGQPNINAEEYKSLKIPLPPLHKQKELVNKFNIAISEKQEKEKKAKLLLKSFEEYILKVFSIKLPKIEFVEQIIVNLQQLENALNVERYAISFDKSTLEWASINNIGEVKLNTIAPSSELYKNNDFTLMRIDDLPNKPQKAEIRKVKGNQIAGNVQRVKEDDVLVARLEPTIVNKKIVSVPKSQNDILASNEFIRLTCNRQNNPLFVKYMLQTDFYTQLMTSKTRGATPSRRRLSRIDFEHLPFPIIDKAIQDKIANEFETRILKAIKLKNEAKENYNKTKSEIENMIINKDKKSNA